MASALTRLIDPAYPSNRFILAATPLAGVVAGAVTLVAGDGLEAALRAGVSGGGVAFLAWALGREIDHDRPPVACLAAVAAPWLLLLGRPDLLGSALLLLAVRVVAGTTGRMLIAVDAAALVAGAAVAATRPAGAAFVGAGVVALGLLARYERSSIAAMAAVVMAAAGIAVGWWGGHGRITDRPSTAEWIVLAVATAALLASVAIVGEVVSPADEPGAVVHRHRVRWARAVAGLAGVGAWVWIGGAGVAAAAAPWSALTMAPLVAVVARIRG